MHAEHRNKKAFSRNELWQKLAEQGAFLRASAGAFDAGFEAESLRMATAVRVLFHETEKSHSLFGQLGCLDAIRLPNTGQPLVPHRERTSDGTGWITRLGFALRLAMLRFQVPGETKFVPALSSVGSASTTDFEEWWSTCVARSASASLDQPPRELSRKQIVLGLSNQEGGAHVDPDPDFEWWLHTRAGSYGAIETDAEGMPSLVIPLGEAARDSMGYSNLTPVHASMRVIAEEVGLAISALSISRGGPEASPISY